MNMWGQLCLVLCCYANIQLFAFLSPTDVTLEKATASANNDAQLFLKYQSRDGDYLLFYDYEGATLYLRYRVDRWDYDNDGLVTTLRQGITYAVQLSALKKLGEGEIPAGVAGAGLPRTVIVRKIRRIRDLYSGKILHINESALRDLRY